MQVSGTRDFFRGQVVEDALVFMNRYSQSATGIV